MQKYKSEVLLLGLYQIIGGGVGLILILILLGNSVSSSSSSLLLIAFMALFFLYSIFCGILCLRMRFSGLTHSVVNQFLQLISLTISGFSFMYAAGIYFMISVDLSQSFEIAFGLGISGFKIQINQESPETIFNLNLIALFLIIWIDKLQAKIEVEKKAIKISSIGENPDRIIIP